ncbi:MAG: hypothetical protein LN590_05425 [Rickettsia endosymbiont of Glossina mortisans submortisans]|nr:hypothetical protein [Rickettsia endosymbiont of Glossina mortisans submortisans]
MISSFNQTFSSNFIAPPPSISAFTKTASLKCIEAAASAKFSLSTLISVK